MILPSGTLTTADQVLKAVGGIDAVVAEATRSEGVLPSGWFNTRIASLLTRVKRQATVIAAREAATRADAAYRKTLVSAP